MRRSGLLLALLALSLALPDGARADTGWSLDSFAARSAATTPPARAATLAPDGPSGPQGLFAALGSTPKALVERGGRETRPPGAAAPPAVSRQDFARSCPVARSRARAARLGLLGAAPALARATRGVTGFHGSPPPPLS